MPNSSISTTYILKPNLQDAFWIGLFWFGAPLFPVHVYSVHWMLLLLPTLVHFSNFPFPHLRIGGLRVQGKGGSNHLQLPRGQETRHKGKWRKELGLSVKAKIEVDTVWRSCWWEDHDDDVDESERMVADSYSRHRLPPLPHRRESFACCSPTAAQTFYLPKQISDIYGNYV